MPVLEREIALVVGGAASVWEEVTAAQSLVRSVGGNCKYFVCNDMIERFSKECVTCTLHVDKLPSWIANRATHKMCSPLDVWICSKEKDKPAAMFATRITDDWGGSCGLFATKIAIQEYSFSKVILCGVPMTIKGRHFVRGQPWGDQLTFVNRWTPHLPYLRNHVRSLSGFTRDWLGHPDRDWLVG